MFQPKLRSILASVALVSILSLLSVPTVDAAPRVRRAQAGAAFSERIEGWGLLAWGFLSSMWEKRSSVIDPEGASASSDGGD